MTHLSTEHKIIDFADGNHPKRMKGWNEIKSNNGGGGRGVIMLCT